jgi:hypothetical protein
MSRWERSPLQPLFRSLGAVTAQIKLSAIVLPLELAGVAAGFVAVASLVYGSALLLRETRIAVQVISERADTVRERFGIVTKLQEPLSGSNLGLGSNRVHPFNGGHQIADDALR